MRAGEARNKTGRAAFCLASRYAHVHGATDNSTPLREPQLLLPAILKHHGYQTAISGKLHFIPDNLAYNFDFFWSFAGEGPHKLPTWPEDVDRKHGPNASRRTVEQPFPNDPLGRDLGRLSYPKEDAQTFWITDRATDFLKRRDPLKPFFLFVSYLDPHSPSHLSEPYWKMFDAEKMPLPTSFKQDPAMPKETNSNRHVVNDPQIVKAMTAAYLAKVTMVDDNVGRLLESLRAQGLAENTLVLFTADHGNMLGDLNRWFKGAMYEGSARIPMLMKTPAASPFAAQFKYIKNETKNSRRGSSAVELYDLTKDPLEMHNLADDPAYAATLRELAAQHDAWQKDMPPVPVLDGVAPEPPPGSLVDVEPKKTKPRRNKRQQP